MIDAIQMIAATSRRGGKRPGAGRKKSSDALTKPKGGRGGTRAGTGRKSKFAEIPAADILVQLSTMIDQAELDGLFTAARAGDFSSLRQLHAFFVGAAERVAQRSAGERATA
jgi:hypothetical protein